VLNGDPAQTAARAGRRRVRAAARRRHAGQMNQYDQPSLSTQLRMVTSLDVTVTSPQLEQFTTSRFGSARSWSPPAPACREDLSAYCTPD